LNQNADNALSRDRFRSGPAHMDLIDQGEGLGYLSLRPPGPNPAQRIVSRPSWIDGHTCLSGQQNLGAIAPQTLSAHLFLLSLVSTRHE
jgi:hypothetical protein